MCTKNAEWRFFSYLPEWTTTPPRCGPQHSTTCKLHHCDRVCYLSRIVLAKSCSAVDPPRKTQTCLSRHPTTDLKPLCASCSLDHAVRRRNGWGKSRVDLKLLRLPAEGGSHAPKISSGGCAPPPRSQVGEAEGLGGAAGSAAAPQAKFRSGLRPEPCLSLRGHFG